MEEAAASSTLIYEGAGSNVVFDSTALGMPGLGGDELFEGCDVVVSERIVNQRVAPCPMEPRAAAATWVDGRLYQWVSTQHAHGAREAVKAANGLDEGGVRVITPDVGGGFGAKITSYPEELLLGRISREHGQPVIWLETRSESMVSLYHGRAQVQRVTIGGTRDGKVLAYRLHVFQDAGGWVDMGTILAPFMTRPMSSGVYAIPTIECQTTSVVTNTAPTTAYRGAGRPEATAAIERAMDLFAGELGPRPGRRPPHQPHRRLRRAPHHGHRPDLRRRELPRGARQGAGGRRLHRAARRAGPPARSPATRCSSASA